MRIRPAEILLALAAVAVGGGLGWRVPPAEASLSFLSVGQGDCSVIRAGGLTVLIDVGPATDTFDAGSRLVAPKLKELGIRQVDLAILTHPDSDHVGGLAGLNSRVRIAYVAAPAHFRDHVDLEAALEKARIPPHRIIWVDRPIRIRSADLQMDVLLPRFDPGEPENDGSPFIRASIGGAAAVFTGDASEESEIRMSGRGHWQAQLLKAGHHGSASSTSTPWLNAVKPEEVIVSCGIDNPFGHPADTVIERIEAAKAELRRTDLEGDVHYRVRNHIFERVRFTGKRDRFSR